MKLCIHGLSKTIQTIVACDQETIPRLELSFKDLVHFSRSEDESFRARARQSYKLPGTNRPYFNSNSPR